MAILSIAIWEYMVALCKNDSDLHFLKINWSLYLYYLHEFCNLFAKFIYHLYSRVKQYVAHVRGHKSRTNFPYSGFSNYIMHVAVRYCNFFKPRKIRFDKLLNNFKFQSIFFAFDNQSQQTVFPPNYQSNAISFIQSLIIPLSN